MTGFILRRALQATVVLAVVALISFTMFRFVGDPVENILGQEATKADYEELVDRLGLEDPIPVQYARFRGQRAARRLRRLLSSAPARSQP